MPSSLYPPRSPRVSLLTLFHRSSLSYALIQLSNRCSAPRKILFPSPLYPFHTQSVELFSAILVFPCAPHPLRLSNFLSLSRSVPFFLSVGLTSPAHSVGFLLCSDLGTEVDQSCRAVCVAQATKTTATTRSERRIAERQEDWIACRCSFAIVLRAAPCRAGFRGTSGKISGRTELFRCLFVAGSFGRTRATMTDVTPLQMSDCR